MKLFRIVLTATFVLSNSARSPGQFEPLLLTGQADDAGRETFLRFGDSMDMSDNGRFAIVGTSISNGGDLNRDTIWVRGLDRQWSLAAGEGLTSFHIDEEETRVEINDRGELLIDEAQFIQDGPIGFHDGVVVGLPGNFRTLGVRGDTLADGTVVDGVEAFGINNAGQAAIFVRSGTTDQIWLGSNDSPAAPLIQDRTPAGLNGDPISNSQFLLQNDNDDVFVFGMTETESGIYRFDGTTRQGEPFATFPRAPGFAEEVGFVVIDRFTIEDNEKEFAFQARVERKNGVTSDDDTGIWKSQPDGSVQLVARQNSDEAGSEFQVLGQAISLHDSQLFFQDFLFTIQNGITGHRNWAVDESNELTELSQFRIGDEAPDEAGIIQFLSDETIGPNGRRAFVATTERHQSNLFYENELGEFDLIAFAGQQVEVGPNDVRTVSSVSEFSFQNDQLVFFLRFEDGASGFFKTWSDVPGDFNNNGQRETYDIDLLAIEMRATNPSLAFDLNGDRLVNESDFDAWVHDLQATFFGDANLDGEFNSADLVAVFETQQYEDQIEMNSGWAQGDWNGDRDFDSRDLVVAFQDGGYENGPRVVAAKGVPEPHGTGWMVIGIVSHLVRLNRGRKSTQLIDL